MRRRERTRVPRMPLSRLVSKKELDAVTTTVLRLMRLWKIDAPEQCAALGLYPHSKKDRRSS